MAWEFQPSGNAARDRRDYMRGPPSGRPSSRNTFAGSRYRSSRRGSSSGNGDWGDNSPMDNGDDFDGRFYDRGGNPISLVIQTPSDMLPPVRRAMETSDGNWRTWRTRSRF